MQRHSVTGMNAAVLFSIRFCVNSNLAAHCKKFMRRPYLLFWQSYATVYLVLLPVYGLWTIFSNIKTEYTRGVEL
jgi:hypothetical protein